MYREPALPPQSELAPIELIYPVVQRDSSSQSSVGFLKGAIASAAVGILFSATTTPLVGVGGLLVTGALFTWHGRRAKLDSWVVLRVDGGDVVVSGYRDKRPRGRFRLADLDVTLDTKTIRAVQDGRSAIPAVRFTEQRAGLEHDIARIVFTDGAGEATPLTEAYVPHMDAIEWFGKIRVFLRKNGWLPEDERE